MNMKRALTFVLLLVACFALSGVANALNVTIDNVELNGVDLRDGDDVNRLVTRDSNVDVVVYYTAENDVENAEVRATLYGYDHDDLVFGATENVDLLAGDYDSVKIQLKLPSRMDQDRYALWVSVADRTGKVENNYLLRVSTERHSVQIRDVDVDPSNGVEAGRSIRALVNLKNYGEFDEDDVKVEFEIPSLGLKALPDYLDVEAEEAVTSEELYLRIPSCTDAGVYEAVARITYDDGDEVEEETGLIEVLASDACSVPTKTEKPAEKDEAKVVVTVGAQSQDLQKGEGGAIYPITFTNTGSATKTFVVSVVGADSWADVRISPLQTVNVGAGESQSIYVYVAAKEEAAAGDRMFSVDIKNSEGATVKQIPLSAVIVESEDSADDLGSLKKGLEVGLIVLVVLLVIMGLVVAFNRMKGNDDDDDQEDEITGQTYY